MGLLSYFQPRTDTAADAPAAEPDAVAAARSRARRRLIGAAVLLGVGVVGFPLLFETQPRPVPVNIPIEIPRKETAAPLAPPGASPAVPAASAAAVLPDADAPAAAASVPAEIVERADTQARAMPPAAASKPARPSMTPAPAPLPAPTAPTAPAAPAAPAADGARAQALLNGQAASATVGRVVVQVGAYSDPAKLRDARQKVEKLGLKTYTQEVQVDGEKRTRVRVGPFASKAEADTAAARIKASGLPVAILTL